MFVALGTQKGLSSKIDKFIALAPVVVPNKRSKLLQIGSKTERLLESSLDALGINEIMGHSYSTKF